MFAGRTSLCRPVCATIYGAMVQTTPVPGNRPTIEALLRAGVRLLAERSSSPRLDAELLLAHAIGCTRTQLYAARTDSVSEAATACFLGLMEERRASRPVAQLIGHREFWSLPLRVTADVLTPRPDTETLVECALGKLSGDSTARILDLGTGTGAIALAIATERPGCILMATDSSAAALQIAQANGQMFAEGRVRWRQGDWWDAVAGEHFNLVVTNPPYLADDEWAACDPELACEPRLALAGGCDGLDAIRTIIAGALDHLAAGGSLLMEHGSRQDGAVRSLMSTAGLGRVLTHRDLAGHPRVTEGTRS